MRQSIKWFVDHWNNLLTCFTGDIESMSSQTESRASCLKCLDLRELVLTGEP